MDWLNERIRSAVLEKLQGLEKSKLTVIDPLGTTVLGAAGEGVPQATVKIHSLSFYRRLVWEGANGAGEAYLDRLWDTDQLPEVMEIFARNGRLAGGLGGRWTGKLADLGRRLLRRNTVQGSRRNISAHYDLSNEFFSLFLDPTMAYSAGVFDEQSAGTMEGASLSKFERVCDSLELKDSDHLLEIGGGWGGLAIHAAKTRGCRVTTTTISREQHRYMLDKVQALGLQDQVTVLCDDYRELQGCYDKIVSIEMIEAVGHEYFNVFFRKCQSLLKSDGLMLLQAILIPDQRYIRYRKSQDFIQRHIFPGGCLPSLGALCASATAETDMKMVQVEDWADHYARTLQLWREQFRAKLDAVRALGMDERFIRAWDYYLCYCEGGFRERQLLLTHLVFAAPDWRGNRAMAPPAERRDAAVVRPVAVQGTSSDRATASEAPEGSQASAATEASESSEASDMEGAWA